MRKELLRIIICPFCKQQFTLEPFFQKDQEILHGLLKCSCREYPIINGIPRIIPDSFRQALIKSHPAFFRKYHLKNYPVPKTRKDTEKLTTTSRFSYQWRKFSQLHPEYETQFLDWLNVPKDFFNGKLVLDAGCGIGRHAYYASRSGAKQVIGVDLGESIEVAYRNNQHNKNTSFIQADLYHLPFKQNTFDYIYTIGVLHHLPQPQEGFRKLTTFVKKKGEISIWVYGKEGNTLLKIVDPIRKNVLSKLPPPMISALSLAGATIVYPVSKIYKVLNEHPATQPLSRHLPQNDFLYYLSKLNFRICHSILFDQCVAPTAYYHTKEEVQAWFQQAGINKYLITARNNNSWRGRGVL